MALCGYQPAGKSLSQSSELSCPQSSHQVQHHNVSAPLITPSAGQDAQSNTELSNGIMAFL